jgi:hypothetical protein
MKKGMYFIIAAFALVSCEKLKDYFPILHEQQPEFSKVYGGTDFDEALSIVISPDGGYLFLGTTGSNDGDVSGNHGSSDMWIVKLDKSGNKEWQKTFGGSAFDGATSIIRSWDGGYMVAGVTGSNDGDITYNHGNFDIWIIDLDLQGNIKWQKTFGGAEQEYLRSFSTTNDGGYIFTSYTLSNDGDVSGNHGNWDVWVVKLDKEGSIIWQKTLGGSDGEEAGSIINSSDGGYITACLTRSHDGNVSGYHGNGDIWIVKLNEDGNIMWQRTLGGTYEDDAGSITEASDGYVVVGGTSSSDGDVNGHPVNGDIWVLKLDRKGSIIWQKLLGGSAYEFAHSIIHTTTSGYILLGRTSSNDGDVSGNHGGQDVWVVKLDNNGKILWQKTLGGTNYEMPYSIITRPKGGAIIAGTSGSNDGDISGNHGTSDAWIVTVKDK